MENIFPDSLFVSKWCDREDVSCKYINNYYEPGVLEAIAWLPILSTVQMFSVACLREQHGSGSSEIFTKLVLE
jgi:hypothetical protein